MANRHAARAKDLGESLGITIPVKVGDRTHVLYDSCEETRLIARIRQEISEDSDERACDCQASVELVEVGIMGTKNLGSSFDNFLEDEGLLEDATATAVKRIIAYQLTEKMSEDNISKSAMARRMETSRSALDRLLDPSNPAVTLQTLQSAVSALGGRLKVELEFEQRVN